MDIRDVKAFLPTMRETDDILTFVMTFERALELNGIDRGVHTEKYCGFFCPQCLWTKNSGHFVHTGVEQ